MFRRHLLLFILFLLPSWIVSSPATSTTTPIRLWEPSWVASSAQGTSVAVSCRLDEEGNCKSDNCVLLLMRSSAPATVTSSLQWKPSPPAMDWKEIKLHNTDKPLRILETPMEEFLATQTKSSWTPIGTGALCAMTGLSSDVDHVTRVLQNQIHQHRVMYDAFPMPVSGIANWLAKTVRNAAKWNGGRPYGLQALLVGRQGQAKANANNPLFVYSVDPSGAWRHWGSGCTAIGRNAEEVRQQLYEELQKEDSTSNLNPLSALKVALEALLQTSKAALVNQENDQYEAVLIWIDPSNSIRCRVAPVNPGIVKACRDELWEALEAAK